MCPYKAAEREIEKHQIIQVTLYSQNILKNAEKGILAPNHIYWLSKNHSEFYMCTK